MNRSLLDKSHNFNCVSIQNLEFEATSKKVVLGCRHLEVIGPWGLSPHEWHNENVQVHSGALSCTSALQGRNVSPSRWCCSSMVTCSQGRPRQMFNLLAPPSWISNLLERWEVNFCCSQITRKWVWQQCKWTKREQSGRCAFQGTEEQRSSTVKACRYNYFI